MLEQLMPLYRSPAVVFATLLLLAGAYFGSSHDFGSFVLSIPTLGLLFLGAVATAAWAESKRRRPWVALALICLTPLVYLCSYGVAQQIRFLLWAPAHYHKLAKSSEKDGIVMGWDSWGMAGEDTFSYLVVDTQNRLGSKARAAQWTKRIGQTCGTWQEQRVWPRLYVVTTYTNCPYDGVAPAG